MCAFEKAPLLWFQHRTMDETVAVSRNNEVQLNGEAHGGNRGSAGSGNSAGTAGASSTGYHPSVFDNKWEEYVKAFIDGRRREQPELLKQVDS